MTWLQLTSALGDLVRVLPSRLDDQWQDPHSLSGERPIVILVSGFAANARTLSIMRRRLVRDGFDVLLVSLQWRHFLEGFVGLDWLAKELTKTIQAVEARNQSITIVAHSAGGLVARHYFQFHAPDSRAHFLVTLATPHSGTWLAGLGMLTHLVLKARCLFQMLPISPFIRHLNRAGFPDHLRMVSIFSRDDVLRSQVRFKGSENVEEIELRGLAHGDFLHRKQVYEILVDRLRREHGAQLGRRAAG